MKKEELQKRIGELESQNGGLKDNDNLIRRELSAMLYSPFDGGSPYDYGNRERVTYSWPEIYYHLGKLQAKRDYLDFEDTLKRHERDLSDLQKWQQDKKDQ